MTEHSEQKRQRVSKACEQCRKKKVKCDGGLPFCNNCNTQGFTCHYKESTKKRGPPKGYIEAIEGRLHRLEALLGSIVQEDDPRSQAIIDELNAPLETAYGELVRPRPMRRETLSSFDSDPNLHNVVETTIHQKEDKEKNVEGRDESNNIGNLSIDENGQLRYYGRSSGFYMLKINKNFQNRSFQFNSKESAHNDSHTALPVSIDPFEMPPTDLKDHLLALYFDTFYPLLPILHKQSFMEAIHDPNQPSTPPAILLNAIFAVASRISLDVRVRAVPDKPETAGDVFFERARMLLDLEWDSFRVSTVQALLLMSSHQNGALKTTRGWLYSGMAIRMSQNLGLHRNCDTWDLSPTEKENRKRAFYGCFVIDRLSCAMHGRSPMIDERDYDTPYPSEDEIDDLDRKPRIMENFLHLIKICEILGEVICALYKVRARRQLAALSTSDNIVSSLDKKLNHWMSKLPANLQYRPPNTRLNESAPAPSLELCQLHMLFYTTLILTHRPFIPGPDQKVAPSVFPSTSICTFAANKILDITESLLAEGRLTSLNNYSLFFMFTAGIIFIYNAASTDSMFALEAKISINKIMRAMDDIERTWRTSARLCNILGALAGLREIDLECVDESYSQSSNNKQLTLNHPPASIAVPNSPEPEVQPVDDMTDHNEFRRMEEKYYAASESSHKSSSIDLSSPELAHVQNSLHIPTQQDSFDPNATAFWGMPMSFDVDEWNSYFSNQKNNTVNSENFVIPVPLTESHAHAFRSSRQ
ncbi:Nitrogen assimilation transcription factor nit-4 [Choanephora cucurbitarum]|uniref:Nitrogen assimilation transcription factor nit-4 n=1 Tax=Choanephora cucurbitarum TaxID=101091 RepID=A0A1C7NJ51_9FUNG|nr:Nitrogen assimilation transcription factor nit-4 [Choanephora cucurbitarum]